MHAFDYISVLFSFVYAAAITHLLATTGDIVIASKRVRLSWVNAGWMLVSLLAVSAWWISAWDLRGITTWSMPLVGFFFGFAALMYLQVRLVSPRIANEGLVDLKAFHRDEGRKYLAAYFIISATTVASNAFFAGDSPIWATQNLAVAPMAITTLVAAIFVSVRWVQFGVLAIQFAMWTLYFGWFQPPLSG